MFDRFTRLSILLLRDLSWWYVSVWAYRYVSSHTFKLRRYFEVLQSRYGLLDPSSLLPVGACPAQLWQYHQYRACTLINKKRTVDLFLFDFAKNCHPCRVYHFSVSTSARFNSSSKKRMTWFLIFSFIKKKWKEIISVRIILCAHWFRPHTYLKAHI